MLKLKNIFKSVKGFYWKSLGKILHVGMKVVIVSQWVYTDSIQALHTYFLYQTHVNFKNNPNFPKQVVVILKCFQTCILNTQLLRP